MTNDESAAALGLWVRDRATRAELSDATRAWLASDPRGDDRPPASVLGDLVIALAAPEAARVIDSGRLDAMLDSADDAMLLALRRVSEGVGGPRVDRDADRAG